MATWNVKGEVTKFNRTARAVFFSVKDGKGYFECVAMGDVISKLNGVAKGTKVDVTGELWTQKLTNKDGSSIQVNGYDYWAVRLVVKAIQFEAKENKPDEGPPQDDDIPF